MTQSITLQQLFDCLSENEKNSLLASSNINCDNIPDILNSYKVDLESFLYSRKVLTGKHNSCPFCGDFHIVKNGKKDGHQRYLCIKCQKTYGISHNSVIKSSKKNVAVWNMYVICMMKKKSLRNTARDCGIGVNTAFIWRHKILNELALVTHSVVLEHRITSDTSVSPRPIANKIFPQEKESDQRIFSTALPGRLT